MNSIRHVLSTTICFRKVVRDRSVGRTLWAIWDEDLPCFEGGGFQKNLCRDMEGKAKNAPATKKRNAHAIDGDASSKKAKRTKKDKTAAPPLTHGYALASTHSFPLFPSTHSAPIFPPVHPTPQHQPYYESCMSQQIPAEIIFPPLPPSASYGYHRVMGSVASGSQTQTVQASQGADSADSPPRPADPPSSMPELTPNRSSSLSPPLPSDASNTNHDRIDKAAVRVVTDERRDLDGNSVFKISAVDSLEPGITLLDQVAKRERKRATGKGKAKHDKVHFDLLITSAFAELIICLFSRDPLLYP